MISSEYLSGPLWRNVGLAKLLEMDCRMDAVEIEQRMSSFDLEKFGIKALYLFGSVARGTNVSTSDIDLLVDFDGPATFDGYMDLKFAIEELLGQPIDLVTRGALKPRLRPSIERDSIRVA